MLLCVNQTKLSIIPCEILKEIIPKLPLLIYGTSWIIRGFFAVAELPDAKITGDYLGFIVHVGHLLRKVKFKYFLWLY